jgi:hypothetical protein
MSLGGELRRHASRGLGSRILAAVAALVAAATLTPPTLADEAGAGELRSASLRLEPFSGADAD